MFNFTVEEDLTKNILIRSSTIYSIIKENHEQDIARLLESIRTKKLGYSHKEVLDSLVFLDMVNIIKINPSKNHIERY